MKILITYLILLFSVLAQAQEGGHLQIGAQQFNHLSTEYLAITFENQPHWHTYWKNPGSAGLSIEVAFDVEGNPWRPTTLEWPVPIKYIEQGDILAYGYEDAYALFFELKPTDLNFLNNKTLTVSAKWLICKEICVPSKFTFKGTFRDNELKDIKSLNWPVSKLKNLLNELPKTASLPSGIKVYLSKQKTSSDLYLHYSYNGKLKDKYQHRNLLYPFKQEPFGFLKEELFYKDGQYFGRMKIEWDGEYSVPPEELPVNGIFNNEKILNVLIHNLEKDQYQVSKINLKSFSIDDDASSERFYSTLQPLEMAQVTSESNFGDHKISLWMICLLAFIGGFILNFMPCVLPVISIKLFSLIKQKKATRRGILIHNLSYTLGILFTFTLLSIVIILLQKAGHHVGWGFQLQSPHFVTAMILVLFIFSLNLFGLFEFWTPGGKTLGGIKLPPGFREDFGSGVLATILATPCSAPFLGTALTFAFTSSPIVILPTFLTIGLGLSFPFLLIGLFPKLIKFLPHPGKWMDHLKKLLGLALLLTIVWLYDVFNSLINNSSGLLYLNLVLVFVFFAIYLYQKMSKNILVYLLFTIIPFFFLTLTVLSFNEGRSIADQNQNKEHGLNWEPWSEGRMLQAKEKGQALFINFTANWCFTCKINERLVFSTDEFEQFIHDRKLVLLMGDWTKRDNKIGDWLKKNSVFGVPAYFIQRPNGELIHLGETISIEKIKNNL